MTMSKLDSPNPQENLKDLTPEALKGFKDPELAIRLYLKSQKTAKKSTESQKKWEDFIKKEGAFLKPEVTQKESQKKAQKPELKISSGSKSLSFQAPQHFLQKKDLGVEGKKPKPAFYLDEVSQQKLEKIQEEWNLESPASALRLVIQAGYKNLNRLKS